MKREIRTLIAGAGEAGRAVLEEYRKIGRDHTVIGFADDRITTGDLPEQEKPVLGTTGEIGPIIRDHSLNQVIIAMPSVEADIIQRIISDALSVDDTVSIHVIPAVERLFDGIPLTPALDDFPITGLLGREEYHIDTDLITGHFRDRSILITGAGGSIGSELCRQILKFNVRRIIALDRCEFSIYSLAKTMNGYLDLMQRRPEVSYRVTDVRDRASMDHMFRELRPDIVIHAAAHKHVPLMESNEYEAIQNNVAGTRNVLEACLNSGTGEFVLISTDKAVHPVNIMGATKRLAELVTRSYNTGGPLRTSIVRFGNVIGSRGSVIPLFREQIQGGGPVTVTHPEVKRYFMSIPEAALLVLNASAYAGGGEIFMLEMGEQYRIIDIARKLIEFYGYVPEKEIRIVYTGLRPGEKLTEVLSYEKESLISTGNKKIHVLKPDSSMTDYSAVEGLISTEPGELIALSPVKIREMIQAIIPEYRWRSKDADCGTARIVN